LGISPEPKEEEAAHRYLSLAEENTGGSGEGILVPRKSLYHSGADDLRHSTGEVSMVQDDAGAQEINVHPELHAAGPSFLSMS
jgi:hypothetical protein